MDVNLLLKLCELKKQEINSLKNDFSTLERIVDNLKKEIEDHSNFIKEFIEEHIANNNYVNSAVSMLNGRAFLSKLNVETKELEESKYNAELQKQAALERLNESALELKKLNKVIEKAKKSEVELLISKDLILNDTLEIYRYNKKTCYDFN